MLVFMFIHLTNVYIKIPVPFTNKQFSIKTRHQNTCHTSSKTHLFASVVHKRISASVCSNRLQTSSIYHRSPRIFTCLTLKPKRARNHRTRWWTCLATKKTHNTQVSGVYMWVGDHPSDARFMVTQKMTKHVVHHRRRTRERTWLVCPNIVLDPSTSSSSIMYDGLTLLAKPET